MCSSDLIRIGMATAKALAQALDVPIAAVSTLAAFAVSDDLSETALICPMLDARRGQVYAGAFVKSDRNILELKTSGVSGIYERLPVNVYMAADFIKLAVQAAEDMQGAI